MILITDLDLVKLAIDDKVFNNSCKRAAFFSVGHGCRRDFRGDPDFVFTSLEPSQSWFLYEKEAFLVIGCVVKDTKYTLLKKSAFLSIPAQGHPSRSSLVHSKLARVQRIVMM